MVGGCRWLPALFCVIWFGALPLRAAEPTPPPTTTETPAAITEDVVRLLELGKMYMGRNNPAYAVTPDGWGMAQRNAAGAQAVEILQTVVKRSPRYGQGWLWLGIALTETLAYGKDAPHGRPAASEANIAEGIDAFQRAYTFEPTNEDCVKYYGDALINHRRDFDGAIALWNTYLPGARTDVQRMMALVQLSRAYLNKAYFGKDKLPAKDVKGSYQHALDYAQQAARICPNSRDVKEMLALLLEHRKALAGD